MQHTDVFFLQLKPC